MQDEASRHAQGVHREATTGRVHTRLAHSPFVPCIREFPVRATRTADHESRLCQYGCHTTPSAVR